MNMHETQGVNKTYTRPSANILLEAADIQEAKGNDYNNASSRVSQADYYPGGVLTLLDTCQAKVLRMYSVLDTMAAGGKINFESVEDSCIDLINYASFIAAYMRGQVPGQHPDHDIFNRTGQTNPDLIPLRFRKVETPLIIGGVIRAKSK
jgi:hypothetical protein